MTLFIETNCKSIVCQSIGFACKLQNDRYMTLLANDCSVLWHHQQQIQFSRSMNTKFDTNFLSSFNNFSNITWAALLVLDITRHLHGYLTTAAENNAATAKLFLFLFANKLIQTVNKQENWENQFSRFSIADKEREGENVKKENVNKIGLNALYLTTNCLQCTRWHLWEESLELDYL